MAVGGNEDNSDNSNDSGHRQQLTNRASRKKLSAVTVMAAETLTAT